MAILFGRGVVCGRIVDSAVLKINGNVLPVVRETRNLEFVFVDTFRYRGHGSKRLNKPIFLNTIYHLRSNLSVILFIVIPSISVFLSSCITIHAIV